jgi:hypothetical protein
MSFPPVQRPRRSGRPGCRWSSCRTRDRVPASYQPPDQRRAHGTPPVTRHAEVITTGSVMTGKAAALRRGWDARPAPSSGLRWRSCTGQVTASGAGAALRRRVLRGPGAGGQVRGRMYNWASPVVRPRASAASARSCTGSWTLARSARPRWQPGRSPARSTRSRPTRGDRQQQFGHPVAQRGHGRGQPDAMVMTAGCASARSRSRLRWATCGPPPHRRRGPPRAVRTDLPLMVTVMAARSVPSSRTSSVGPPGRRRPR